MNKYILIGSLSLLTILAGCDEDKKDVKTTQSEIAQRAADSVEFTDNQEINNLKRRLEMNAKPGGLQYILLISDMGTPLLYEAVDGKITSSNKRLTRPDRLEKETLLGYDNIGVRNAPSDTGTWGSSDSYIFYWNTSGAYR